MKAEADDICTIMDGLRELKWNLVPILGVLKAEKEDQLADFSTRRMEKKDKLYRQRRQKEKQLWRETSE